MLQAQAYALLDILCHHGCTHFIICPGSRNAPLTLAIARHGVATATVVPDERAAGYMALGMALAKTAPIAIVTTSGTAALNLMPAVAEAYFQQVPLLIISADRPPEWIDQQDGQAVFQAGVFGRHVKASYQTPLQMERADDANSLYRMANEAAMLAKRFPLGPVHINMPFAEPFYPTDADTYLATATRKVEVHTDAVTIPKGQRVPLFEEWKAAEKKMLIIGQMPYSDDFRNAIKALVQYEPNVVVVADATANLHGLGIGLEGHGLLDYYDLKRLPIPNLVLHMGGSMVGRKVKKWLRHADGGKVWRLQPFQTPIYDVFQKVERVLVSEEAAFLDSLAQHSFFSESKDDEVAYALAWANEAKMAKERYAAALVPYAGPVMQAKDAKEEFCEAQAMAWLLPKVPSGTHLHISNSMPIRWVGWQGLLSQAVRLLANRGTSGIDGCTSTAVGNALACNSLASNTLATDTPVMLITGDTAFHYDRNGLWLSQGLPANLKIVVLNNGGGAIFGLIDGPAGLPELDKYFYNPNHLTAERTASDFGMAYYQTSTMADLEGAWGAFMADSGPALLEFHTSPSAAKAMLDRLKGNAEAEILPAGDV